MFWSVLLMMCLCVGILLLFLVLRLSVWMFVLVLVRYFFNCGFAGASTTATSFGNVFVVSLRLIFILFCMCVLWFVLVFICMICLLCVMMSIGVEDLSDVAAAARSERSFGGKIIVFGVSLWYVYVFVGVVFWLVNCMMMVVFLIFLIFLFDCCGVNIVINIVIDGCANKSTYGVE